jgi:hypothetical protein
MPFDTNGLEISEYEAMRLERIARNVAYLESLGLGDANKKLFATMTAKTKRNATRGGARSSPKPKPGKERRSKRLTNRNKAALVMISYSDEKERVVEQVTDSDEDFELEGNSDCDHNVMASSRHSRLRKYSIISNWKLTEEEKKVLQRNIDDSYLAKFEVGIITLNVASELFPTRRILNQLPLACSVLFFDLRWAGISALPQPGIATECQERHEAGEQARQGRGGAL